MDKQERVCLDCGGAAPGRQRRCDPCRLAHRRLAKAASERRRRAKRNPGQSGVPRHSQADPLAAVIQVLGRMAMEIEMRKVAQDRLFSTVDLAYWHGEVSRAIDDPAPRTSDDRWVAEFDDNPNMSALCPDGEPDYVADRTHEWEFLETAIREDLEDGQPD